MHEKITVFDGHNDSILKLEIAARTGTALDFSGPDPALHIDISSARKAGFSGGLFAMFTPSQPDRLGQEFDPGDPANFAPLDQPTALKFTLAMFSRLRRLARDKPEDLALCTDSGQARAAMGTDRIAIVPHIEGAECIDTDFNALEILHAAGLRSLGPVWSRDNVFGHGAPMARQPDLDPGKGLTPAGVELVRECNRLGILVDLSHLTEAGFWDVAKSTSRPLVASHSNAHAISPSARNLTDRQLAAVAESGGLVGLNFHVAFLRPDCRHDRNTPLDLMIRHLSHMLSILGEDGVALGSDFDGCMLPDAIGGVGGLPDLIDAMQKAQFGQQLIRKICFENWLVALDRAAA
ncbi:dipeptidase [Sedimentitalea nanhaiensis]|uniref:Membrane dipeptidase n=1 Tax=Sedimentitalea nanhaiensis TaxID=999627 RepID=A0A1I7CSN7_9RHOB|nr:dipeptidase [Sedimentitalea nanhaiensis]SFU02442.1 membrane dipeptidase [Sedimentitalea nanhaiensis]